MRTAEDAKLNPMPGDVLRKDSRTRTVRVVLYGPFVCRTEEWRCRPNGAIREVDSRLKQWRKWAANAEVIKVAQEQK